MPEDPADKGGNDPATAFQNALAKKNGDALQLASQLFDENFSLRGEKRALKAEAEELKTKIPAADAVVLTPAQASDYDEYKALGKADELKKRLDNHATQEQEISELKQKDVLREVADLHDFKLSVLLDRDKAAGGLEISFKESKGDKVALVKDGDKDTPLTEYAETHWADYMPSLKAEQAPQPRASSGFDPKPKGNGAPTVQEIKQAKLRSGYYAI
ncbi:MAG: hypothetical protein H0V18_07780 [Pyrinomonadaceae bacterium]|nr:hypothetical protein [Pyrinomonadaceae bacterium]